MAAIFNTITGEAWARSLRAARARRTRHVLEIADIRRRATAARNNTLAVGLADGAQGDPATALDPTRGFVVAHETKTPTAIRL